MIGFQPMPGAEATGLNDEAPLGLRTLTRPYGPTSPAAAGEGTKKITLPLSRRNGRGVGGEGRQPWKGFHVKAGGANRRSTAGIRPRRLAPRRLSLA